ncbi:nitrogen fixation protein FixF [Pseudooceanicola sediminis]|uniref:Nitrogen fixation protein FixF n=1 Tax=Pseudooceanicola sediminis TaxID=2211117 RepID=A0A399IZ86_9RHOB|nr:nitrogen fixation protein FixF [Pseudooceanicola sediminis]KAA2313401.1 nitrogen fixation protein FixF [Puniceibacterium sp. HSS470]RII38320.1 nitrogen fixation protein FixF [Pseudooceanicola sediminis]|tara:strand:+ start:57873 stop:59003 length:1131 start_codon:yes stop_codon:yes gene_type:complete
MFVKLDTGVVRHFDEALAGEVEVISTRSLDVYRRLAALRGAAHARRALWQALRAERADIAPLVEGNLARKRIRLPGVFGNPVIGGMYGAIKRVQAHLLRALLKAEFAEVQPDRIAIVYNGSNYPESVLAEVTAGHPRVFVEAGFFPATLQVDAKGLNGGNSVPRTPSFYLDTDEDFAAGGLPATVNNRPSKGTFAPVDLTPGFVFVPFQVPSDMQVTLHSPWVRDMEQFLDVVIAAAEANPDQTFVIKEHPSFKRSVIGLRLDHPRVIFANGNVTSEMIAQARAVLTLNSTVGIEALLLDKPVITLGDACYNIEGLVLHAGDADALNAALARRDWRPDPRLRRQFIGYLWNRYLVHGRYDDLPEDLSAQLKRAAHG